MLIEPFIKMITIFNIKNKYTVDIGFCKLNICLFIRENKY